MSVWSVEEGVLKSSDTLLLSKGFYLTSSYVICDGVFDVTQYLCSIVAFEIWSRIQPCQQHMNAARVDNQRIC